MRFLRNMSIRRKLTLVMMLTSCGALLLCATGFVVYDVLTLRAEMREDLDARARLVAQNTVAALISGDERPVRESIEELKSDPHLVAALVFKESGHPVRAYVRPGYESRFAALAVAEDGARFIDGLLVAVQTVVDNERPVGQVQLYTDLEELHSQLERYLGIVTVVFAGGVIFALAMSALLQRLISVPILNLAQTALEVTAQRNYGIRAPKLAGDEVGRLVDNFNGMLEQIEERDLALRQAHEELEQRVRDRTIALQLEIAEHLKTTEERDRFFTLSEDLLCIAGVDGWLRRINPAFVRTLGLSNEELMARPFLELVHAEDRAATAEEVERLACGLPTRNFQNRVLCQDGSHRWIIWNASPVVESGLIYCYGRDVTERKQAEEALRESQSIALRQERLAAVGQLSAGVAHDFNNIMTVIQGHASLLLAEPALPQNMAASLREISTAAMRAASLTEQLLAFSRKRVMRCRNVNLTDVLTNISAVLASTLGERIRLRSHFAPDVPLVYADPGMIEQIVVNLAMNSRDAMPEGGELSISVATEDVAAERSARFPDAIPGRFVCLTVSDTGRGMEPATLKRLFEPFFTTKEVGKGTGLGLATVYGLVKQHQGWIEAESQPERGTTFRAYFPVSASAAAPVKEIAASGTARGNGETVLVVEDEPALRSLVKRICERSGYRVLEAECGEAAWELVGRTPERIDLLLTDLIMPGSITGKELARRLQEQNPTTKVIFTSGYSQETVGREFFQDGVNFLQKPYQPSALTRMLQGCLRPVN